MIIYNHNFTYEHVICLYCYLWWWLFMMLCYVKLDITYDFFPCLLGYVGLWDFTWALHLYAWDGIVGVYELLYRYYCYDIILVLLWLYDHDILLFMLIWSYVDSIHLALTLLMLLVLCCIWTFLNKYLIIGLHVFLFVH